MVNVPVRDEPPECDATLNVTLPFPLPLEPDASVIHELLLWLVHAQPPAVETATEKPLPPPAATD
jgi:hypothetical protein